MSGATPEAIAVGLTKAQRCHKCGAGPIGNCGYYGCETPRKTCPLAVRTILAGEPK